MRTNTRHVRIRLKQTSPGQLVQSSLTQQHRIDGVERVERLLCGHLGRRHAVVVVALIHRLHNFVRVCEPNQQKKNTSAPVRPASATRAAITRTDHHTVHARSERIAEFGRPHRRAQQSVQRPLAQALHQMGVRQLRRAADVIGDRGRIVGGIADQRPRRQAGAGHQHGPVEQHTCAATHIIRYICIIVGRHVSPVSFRLCGGDCPNMYGVICAPQHVRSISSQCVSFQSHEPYRITYPPSAPRTCAVRAIVCPYLCCRACRNNVSGDIN